MPDDTFMMLPKFGKINFETVKSTLVPGFHLDFWQSNKEGNIIHKMFISSSSLAIEQS